MKGDVFTEDAIETWIDYKTDQGSGRRSVCGPIRTSSSSTTTFRTR
ncbi:MAG: hypothetical protein MZV70_44365 [Desulfobacterales bacterium]|nr:hypothetical protein [Desulfobacterales bacterium]